MSTFRLTHGSLTALDDVGKEVMCVRMQNAEAIYDDVAAQDRRQMFCSQGEYCVRIVSRSM